MGPREITREAAHLDRRIADYPAGLDESDDGEPNEALSATAVALQALRERRAELDRLASSSTPKDATRWSRARLMPGPWESAMDQSAHPNNLQTAVDADTGLILHHEAWRLPLPGTSSHQVASNAELPINRLPALAPSPQPRPAPTRRPSRRKSRVSALQWSLVCCQSASDRDPRSAGTPSFYVLSD